MKFYGLINLIFLNLKKIKFKIKKKLKALFLKVPKSHFRKNEIS